MKLNNHRATEHQKNSSISFPFLTAIGIILLFINIQCAKKEKEINYKIITLEEAKSVLVKSNIKNEAIFRDRVSSTINADDIKKITSIISLSIEKYNQLNKNRDTYDFMDYRFYFIPAKNEKGDLITLVFAYCYDVGEEWWSFGEVSMVQDGGNCHFSTTIRVPNSDEPIRSKKLFMHGEA